MSQATPSTMGASVSPSRKSTRSPFIPPRYPSFSFRRAVSRTPDRMAKDDNAIVADALRTCSAPTTMSESDGPLDGKLFHVRVTLGYLKAIRKTEKPHNNKKRHTDTSLVTAFASLGPEVSSHHNFAPSLPLSSVASSVNNIVWPKQQQNTDMEQEDSNKSNRRLYFSTTLQPEDEDETLRHVLSREDDLSTVTGTSAWDHQEEIESFAPKLIKIQLGVARGKDLLHLGVATLVVDGNDVSGKQMDLPIRSLLPGEDDSSGVATKKSSASPKRRGLKRLFGKKSKSAQNAFEADPYDYSLTSNALLRIRIDIISDATPLARTSLSGPAVWGDGAEDDNDSFASIVVMDLNGEAAPHEEGVEVPRSGASKGEASSRVVQIATDTSESIEIVNNPTGPSIISTPLQFAEPDVMDFAASSTHDASILPITSVEIAPMESCISPTSRYSGGAPSIFQTTGMMCGFADAFNPPGIEADTASHDFEDSSTIATSHYNGTRGEAWKSAARKKSSNSIAYSQSTGTSFIHRSSRTLGTVDERTEDNTSRPSRTSASRTSASRTSALRPTNSRAGSRVAHGDISIGEDTLKSLDDAKKALQCYAERTGDSYHQMLEHLEVANTSDILSLEPSIGEATIDSVFEAKELLQSYASRVGLDVEDLLAIDLVNWDSLASPFSAFGTSRSGDETEGTRRTNSSEQSRFSLFVDE